jgi:hypothetical protein
MWYYILKEAAQLQFNLITYFMSLQVYVLFTLHVMVLTTMCIHLGLTFYITLVYKHMNGNKTVSFTLKTITESRSQDN